MNRTDKDPYARSCECYRLLKQEFHGLFLNLNTRNEGPRQEAGFSRTCPNLQRKRSCRLSIIPG